MLSAVVAVTAVTAASDTAGGLSRLFQFDHIPDDGGNDGQKQKGDQYSTHNTSS